MLIITIVSFLSSFCFCFVLILKWPNGFNVLFSSSFPGTCAMYLTFCKLATCYLSRSYIFSFLYELERIYREMYILTYAGWHVSGMCLRWRFLHPLRTRSAGCWSSWERFFFTQWVKGVTPWSFLHVHRHIMRLFKASAVMFCNVCSH